MTKTIITLLVAVAVIAIVIFAAGQKASAPSVAVSPPEPSGVPVESESAETSLLYTDSGFSPTALTVTSGSTVTIINESDRPLQLSSDQHPTHQINSELNQSVLAAGESRTMTVTKKGIFGFHDHLRPDNTGTLTVE